MLVEILGSHGSDYEHDSLQGYSAVWSRSRPTFQTASIIALTTAMFGVTIMSWYYTQHSINPYRQQ
jgi:hypothetical protein